MDPRNLLRVVESAAGAADIEDVGVHTPPACVSPHRTRRPPLVEASNELRAAIAAESGERDVDTLTEVLWATLHGLIMLDRGGRLRPQHDDQRIELLATQLRLTP